MKQTKWQRLATIGLCSSLVINAFSGVTAVAETITIESSPTVASSAKEATSASSATPESTESSQETTETSREEVTQETVEQEDTTEIAQEENLLEPSGIQAKIMPRAFVWAATGTTNRTTVRLNDVVDYRMKLENITTDDTNSDIVGPIRIESKLAAGMTRPTSVIIKVGPEEQNVVIGEGSHNANSGGEYFVWTESTRTVTAFINRLHGRTSGNTGYIKTLYFQTRITSGTHNEKKYIDSTIRFNGFGAVNRRNEMTYVDRFSGNLGLKGNLKFYDEDGVASKEQMSLSINPVLFKSTNSRVEGTLLRYPLTMTNAGSGLYRFDTGLKNIGTSNGGSWFFFSNDIVINFATATTNRIDKIVLAPPKATLPDSRTGVMTSRAYTSTTYTRSNYDISTYNFTKATGKTWRITNRSSNSGVSTNIMFSDNLVGTTGQFNKGNSGATINYYIYYKKLYENFVNSNGQKITPPSGFTQGKRTVINSEAYTFKQSGTLPDTYQADGKTYKFKGWYKGKTKPNTLTTTKAPSYAVTYDGNDDLTVVYEAIQEGKGMSSVQVMNKAIQNPVTLPDRMYRVLFINETGGLTFADRYGFTGELVEVADGKVTPIGPVPTNNNSAVKEITIPGRVFDTERPTPLQYGVRNATFTLPKMYKTVTYQPGPNYTGTAYSIPETYRLSLRSGVKSDIDTTGWRIGLDPTTDPQKFTMSGIYWSSMPTNVRLATLLSATITGKGVEPSVYTLDENARMYLYLENRRVTENFVDTNGTKITAPSGFAQGKKTVITSDSYTFKQSGDLPDTYKVGTKTYQFKGWYKGKNKPDTLTTTKAPSYPVTYNDDDDLTVVYEEVVMKTYNLPAKDVYFGYVDEAGNLLNTAGFSVEAELGESDETESTVLGKIQGTDEVMSKLKKLSIPGKSYDFPIDKLKTYGARSVNHTIPKQYKTMSITPLATYTGDKTKYPMTKEIRKNIEAPYTVVSQADGVEAFKLTNAGTFFRTRRAFWTWDPNNTLYAMGIYSGTVGKNYNLASPEGTIYYYLENRRVTENFVDPSGAKITPPTGFTQGKQTVIDSDNFTYASTKALPDTYTTGDKSYKFKGWYKGKTKPGTLTTTKTPSYAVTYDDKDDMTAVYEEVQPTAEMTVSRLLEVIPNEASMMWIVKLKNTSEVPLTNVKLAPTAKWAAGISPPTQLAVRIGNTPNKIIPVTAEQWQAGVNLDIEIPVNGEALVTVNTAKITGEPRQLLTAEMTASGNFSAVTASNFVRIQGEDQTITPTPVEEGFISTPTFDFGKITINSSTKQYGLKKAADYYGNGTRNPYLRIKTSQPNWQLTAQLSQLTASADSLPTSTRLLLGSADVIAIENYNQVTELTNKVGVTKALTLTSDGTSTPVILNNQFTGNDVYQLDFDFANVKLEVPANQGKINEKYQGTVTWNLVTGP
ncbi:TPA: WxL domain-containing protein [Enterococcus faecalis]